MCDPGELTYAMPYGSLNEARLSHRRGHKAIFAALTERRQHSAFLPRTFIPCRQLQAASTFGRVDVGRKKHHPGVMPLQTFKRRRTKRTSMQAGPGRPS